LLGRLNLAPGVKALRLRFKTPVFHASITSERDLTRYVAWVAGLCLAGATVVNTLIEVTFDTDLGGFVRDTVSTLIIVPLLAIPIARAIGKSHLELYRAKQATDRLTYVDQLTDLPNRRAFMDAAEREKADILALVIIDVDRFKTVNDTHGHLAGDQVLRRVGRMMANALGDCGCVARIGGEEFALLGSKVPLEELLTRLIAFRESLAGTPIVVNGAALQVTVSAGVALRAHDDTFDRLFSRADRALYSAKAGGRNRIRICTPTEEPRDVESGTAGDLGDARRTA